jgi:glycosyltransferase involved in cell wall biosynthesis
MGKLRILHSFAVERLYRKDIDFVLAIGHLGVRWYAMCGYPLDRVFPWGYFVERCDFDSGTAMTEATTPSIFEMCYVGRCIRGKGIDVLLNALASITEDRWRLHIVGDGPERQRLQQLAHARGIGDRVCLWGVKTNREARHLLSQSDVLVFPSEIDGWGAVVNEALMCGVPVICSDYCGAADLVRSSGYGSLFHTGSSEHLARVLREQMAKGKETVSSRKEITTWSRRVEGEAAARYFVDVLDHVQGRTTRPSAPWLT